MGFIKNISDKFYPYFDSYVKKANCVSVHPADLFFAQYEDGKFCRYDMIVRYLFAENYFGKNNYGEALYRKMQQARIGENQQAVDRFNTLIASYEENGYAPSSYILVKQNLSIRNGSHRGALALYYNQPITCCFEKDNSFVYYPLEWFDENGFDAEEIRRITDKAEAVEDLHNQPLNIVIFGSSADEADEVCRCLTEFGTVVSCEQFYPDHQQCFDICKGIFEASDLYGNKKELKLSVNNPRYALIRLKLSQPQIVTADNDEIELMKNMLHYRIPVLSQSSEIRRIINEKTFVKNDMLFIPQNFYQNSKIENILKESETK